MSGVRVARAMVALGALFLVTACSPTPSSTPTPGATGVVPTPVTSGGATAEEVRVALGMYSGRPDPEWVLTADQVAALDAEIAVLPDATGTPLAGGLGYRGFTVTRPGRSFTAYQGAVAAPGPDPRPFKRDAGRAIERLLLETGRSHLTPDEIAAVERALQE